MRNGIVEREREAKEVNGNKKRERETKEKERDRERKRGIICGDPHPCCATDVPRIPFQFYHILFELHR